MVVKFASCCGGAVRARDNDESVDLLLLQMLGSASRQDLGFVVFLFFIFYFHFLEKYIFDLEIYRNIPRPPRC